MSAEIVPERAIAEARSRRRVSEVARRFIVLRGAGAGEWRALCPFHKGSRPSFTVSDRHGFYYCFGCREHGDAIDLLMRLGRMSFADAVRELLDGDDRAFAAPKIAQKPNTKTRQRESDDGSDDGARARAWAMVERAAPIGGTPAERYLRWRGIQGSLPGCFRFATATYWHRWKGDEELTSLGVFPALLTAVEDDNGIAAVQLTYLDPALDGCGKLCLEDRDSRGDFLPPKKTRYALGHGAVRLASPVDGWLGLAEGVETALSVMELLHFPCWAVLGHNRFCGRLRRGEVAADAKAVALPSDVRGVVIFADRARDGCVDPTALEAAEALEARGYRVNVWPSARSKDWNDELRAHRGAPIVEAT